MALLNLNLPVIGQASATEDQKTRDALVAIQTQVNGLLDATNIAASYVPAAVGAFKALRNGGITYADGSRVDFDTEEGDPSGWLSGGIYTPQVAGWYAFSWIVGTSTTLSAGNFFQSSLFKNGTQHWPGVRSYYSTSLSGVFSNGSGVAQANGTTDSFDVRVNHNQGGVVAIMTGVNCMFGGFMVGR